MEAVECNLIRGPKELQASWSSQKSKLRKEEKICMREASDWRNISPDAHKKCAAG